MLGLLRTNPNRRARARTDNRVRPWLEELEPRTVFAVSSVAFPAALVAAQVSPAPAAATATANPFASQFTSLPGGTFGAPFSGTLNVANPLAPGQSAAPGGALFGLPPTLTANLGGPLPSAPSPTSALSPATLSPESLPLSSTAPVAVLDPANYLLASGFNPALNAGNLPTLLLTQTSETVLQASGGGNTLQNQSVENIAPAGNRAPAAGAPANAIPGNVTPAATPADIGPAPEVPEEAPEGLLGGFSFLPMPQPAGQDNNAQADHGRAPWEWAVPLGEPPLALAAEPLAVAGPYEG
jgi:hypothetical protein